MLRSSISSPMMVRAAVGSMMHITNFVHVFTFSEIWLTEQTAPDHFVNQHIIALVTVILRQHISFAG